MITDVASTSSLRNPPAISQYCVALRLSVSEAGNMDDSAGGETLGDKRADIQFIQREYRKCVGCGSQGFEWLFNDLTSQSVYARLLEKQFPEELVLGC